MAEIKRGLITRNDAAWYDGVTRTDSRVDATGGTVTGLNFGDEVDVLQVFGSGTDRAVTPINDAVGRLGGSNATLLFSTGTWTIDDDLSIPSNVTCHIPAGAIFNVSSGKTLTISGYVLAEATSWTSGAGTVNGDSSIPGVYYKRTAAEVTENEWGVDHSYIPGDVRRYVTADGSTDNTTGLQSWLSVCLTAKNYALFYPPADGSNYILDGQLTVTNGIKGILGLGGVLKCIGTGTTGTDYDGIIFTECNYVEINGMIVDANNKFVRAYVLRNCLAFSVTKNKTYNLKQGSGIEIRALTAGSQGSVGHVIADNYFQGSISTLDIIQAIDFQVDFDPSPSANLEAFWITNGSVPSLTWTNQDCTVTGNVMNGCRYAIHLNGCDNCTFTDNVGVDNTRGLISNFSSNRNTISNNTFRNFLSTGVYLSFESNDNVISGNNCHTNAGSGGLYVNVIGCKRNKWVGNKGKSTDAAGGLNYLIYVGVESDDVIVQDNDVEGICVKPGICVESAWDDATSENSSWTWGNSETLTGMTHAGMSGVIVQGNRVKVSNAPEHSIALLQIKDDGTDYSLTNCVVKDNTVVGTTSAGNPKQLYLYEDTSGQSTGHICLDNNFDPDDDETGFEFPRGRAHFAIVDGNTILDRGSHTITFDTSDATPSVALGHVFKTSDTTTYTDFDDGVDGQEFYLLANHAATVTDGSNILTSTGANKTLTVDVLYKFKSIGGVWYELATA